MVCFQDLPFELHQSIHGYLGQEDRIQCKQVCWQWYGIFDKLQSYNIGTIDTPEKYWTLIKKYTCNVIKSSNSLAIENVPIDLGMDLVARSSSKLASLSLKMQGFKATRSAFSAKYPISSAYTSSGTRWKLHIARMIRAYGVSLSTLVLSYPTSKMNVEMDALIAALPSCLNSLILHQIDSQVSVLDLEHLYYFCRRLSEISLQGFMFQKVDHTELQQLSAVSANGNAITSLELDFERVDSVRQIMEFITVVHSDRHLKLEHVNLDFGLSTRPHASRHMDDCPQRIYDTFAKKCQQLTSISFRRVILVGLLDAVYHQTVDGYHGPVRLAFNKTYISDKWFTGKLKAEISKMVESITVTGDIRRRDMIKLRDVLLPCRRLQHLELYGNQQQIRESNKVNSMHIGDPLHYRWLDHGVYYGVKAQLVNSYLPKYDWFLFPAQGRYITRRTIDYIWHLRPLSDSLTSLTLRQLPLFFRDNQLYLSTRLRKLTLQKIVVSEAYLKILFYLEALEDLHLDNCFTVSDKLHLNLMRSKTLERLEISQLVISSYEKSVYPPIHLSKLHLLQVRQANENYVEQKFRHVTSTRCEMYVVCHSLQVLVVDGKKILG